MREYIENNIYTQEFESLEDIIECANKDPIEANERSYKGVRHRRGVHSTEWFGPENYSVEDVINNTKGQWGWGIRKINEMEKIDSIGILHKKRIRSRGDFGNEVDIHRVYRGDLGRAWSTTPKVEAARTKPISIAIPIGGNYNVLPEVLFWRAAAGIKLVESLNYHNVPTRLYGYNNTTNPFIGRPLFINGVRIQNKLNQIYLIKDHHHPLELDKCIKICAMAGFFRYYIFLCILSNPHFEVAYGFGENNNSRDLPLFNGDKVFITPLNIKNKKQAEEWIGQTHNKIILAEHTESML